jgi:hypothetical protein
VLAGSSFEEVQGVRDDGQHRLEPLADASGASREVEHQGSAHTAGDAARKRGERRGPQTGGPHELGQSGRFAVDDRPRGLGRDVAGAKAGPTSGDDE